MLRQQAIVIAILRRRADALREFIKNDIEDDSLQRSLMDDLDTQQITAATVRGDADELRTLLPRVRRTEERARAMAEIAVVLEKKGDHDEAVRLLDEARTLIKVDFESETQSNALLALVAAYAVVEPPKAFAIIERTIDRANDQIAKALLLDKIVRSGVVKNGELLMQNSSSHFTGIRAVPIWQSSDSVGKCRFQPNQGGSRSFRTDGTAFNDAAAVGPVAAGRREEEQSEAVDCCWLVGANARRHGE